MVGFVESLHLAPVAGDLLTIAGGEGTVKICYDPLNDRNVAVKRFNSKAQAIQDKTNHENALYNCNFAFSDAENPPGFRFPEYYRFSAEESVVVMEAFLDQPNLDYCVPFTQLQIDRYNAGQMTPDTPPPVFEKEKTRLKLDWEDVCNISNGLFDFLQFAKATGYRHVDLKPSNLFYDKENKQVIIIDFGGSQATPYYGLTGLDEVSEYPMTNTENTDIYAVAQILFELVEFPLNYPLPTADDTRYRPSTIAHPFNPGKDFYYENTQGREEEINEWLARALGIEDFRNPNLTFLDDYSGLGSWIDKGREIFAKL